MNALGQRLRRLRMDAGLTQQELAAPDYTHAYVSTIEAGRQRPSRAALEHFAGKLGIGVEQLETGRPPDLADRLTLELQEARRAVAAGLFDDAVSIYAKTGKQAKRYSLTRLEAKAEVGLALCDELRGDLESAIARYEDAEIILKEEPITARVDAIVGRCRCLAARGETKTPIYVLEQTIEAIERENLTEPSALMRLHTSLVAAYFERGAFDRAAASAETALSLAPRTEDPERVASMYVNVARIFLDQDRIDDAHDCLRKAEDLYRELDLQSDIADCHHSRAFILARHDRLPEAAEEQNKALAIYRAIDAPIREARSTIELARLARLQGEVDEAEELLAKSFELLAGRQSIEVAEATRELALCRAEADVAEGIERMREAADLFAASEEQREHAATRRLLGDLLIESGNVEGAAQAYRDGLIAIENI